MFVKFISKKNEWFDEGTEVFDGSINEYNKPIKRILYSEYVRQWEKSGIILGFGLRNGRWDMEVCPLEEFEILRTEEQYESS
jgi:hypothetical protein